MRSANASPFSETRPADDDHLGYIALGGDLRGGKTLCEKLLRLRRLRVSGHTGFAAQGVFEENPDDAEREHDGHYPSADHEPGAPSRRACQAFGHQKLAFTNFVGRCQGLAGAVEERKTISSSFTRAGCSSGVR